MLSSQIPRIQQSIRDATDELIRMRHEAIDQFLREQSPFLGDDDYWLAEFQEGQDSIYILMPQWLISEDPLWILMEKYPYLRLTMRVRPFTGTRY